MLSIRRCKSVICCLFFSLFLFLPNIAYAEIFYIMPRLGLNVALGEKGSVSNGVLGLSPSGTNATFIASLAGGVHFSRIPLRFELDLSFRTDSKVKDSNGAHYVNAKIFQLSPMLNAYYDIYIQNISLVPYIGVGIGMTAFFVDTKAHINQERYTSDALGSVAFSWAIMAGVSFPVDRFLLDFSFRFADGGKAKLVSGGLSGYMRMMNFDFLFGVRFPV